MAAIEFVVAETLFSKAFVPILIATATPMAARNIGGSSHDSHMMNSTIISKMKAVRITLIGAVLPFSLVSTTTLLATLAAAQQFVQHFFALVKFCAAVLIQNTGNPINFGKFFLS